MTADHEWNPLEVRLAAVQTTEEEEFRRIAKIARDPLPLEFESDAALVNCSPVYNEQTFTERLIAKVNITRPTITITQTDPLPPLTANHFGERWINAVASRT